MYDVVIIGAGVAGSFIARELARYELSILVADRENDVGNETTSANSAIIHAGYDASYSKLKGRFNAAGNAKFDQICKELDVPFKRIGSLVIGFNDADRKTIEGLLENGRKNHVPNLRIMEKDEILGMEPNLNPEVTCALYAPTAGIISPWELAIASAENAVDNGVELKLETTVKEIKKRENGYTVVTDKGAFETKYIINCAGVYADKINNMVTEPYFTIRPKRGNYYVLDKGVKNLVSHVIFQCPTENGKGVLVTPTIHGNYMVGPDSDYVEDKDCTATSMERLEVVKEASRLTMEAIPFHKVIRTFAGLRAVGSTGDFIIEEAKGAKGFINVAGYESPGLSSIPAAADYVVEMVREIAGGLKKKENYHPERKPVIRFDQLTEEEKNRLIQENPAYGRIICRCETVTEGEIIDAIHRNVGGRTIKGIKKRCRPGAGRCQGGFCGPRVLELLARELETDPVDVPYDSSASYILTGPTKNLKRDVYND